MTKVHGKRYAYKFDFHGLMAACQAQAQGCDATSSMSMLGTFNVPHHQHHPHPHPYAAQHHSLHHSSGIHVDHHTSQPVSGSNLCFLSPSTSSIPSTLGETTTSSANMVCTSSHQTSVVPSSTDTSKAAETSVITPTTSTASTFTSRNLQYWPYSSSSF